MIVREFFFLASQSSLVLRPEGVTPPGAAELVKKGNPRVIDSFPDFN